MLLKAISLGFEKWNNTENTFHYGAFGLGLDSLSE